MCNIYFKGSGMVKILPLDSGGNVSDLVLARNCCLARMLPDKLSWCRNEQVCQGGQKV